METLYELIPRDKLRERLGALANCLNLPIQLLNEEGLELLRFGEGNSYCALLKKNIFLNGECAKLHLKAGQIAYALGESYIFSCHASLNHIAFPLVHHKLLFGTIILGPFLMDQPDNTLISELAEKYKLTPALCLELYDELQKLPVVTPQQVKEISHLIDFVFSPLFADERLLMQEKQEKLYQQSRINETIQRYKGNTPESGPNFIYAKEKELLTKVKTCDLQSAKSVLNELLGFVLFAEGKKNSRIKSRALELTTLLSRVAIEGGAPVDRILDLNHLYLTQLEGASNYEALCFALQEIVENFIKSISMPQQDPSNANIRRAVSYIATHFDEALTIHTLSAQLGISASYFSSLFTKHMQIGFHEYLTRVRIEESKNLLLATDYPLNQIAISVGYSDQSSFTKAFKRVTGLTPHQLR